MLLGEALRDERREKGLCVDRGDCFLRLGELAYTLADYQQALELSPGDCVVPRRVAAALHEQGQRDLVARQYRQAESRFSVAIEHEPQKPLYYLCWARAHLCLRRVEKTVRAALRSETGCLAQETLEKTLQSPPELTVLADVAWCDSSNRDMLGASLSWVLAH
ncbi:tetratricopeptide repeat protein 16 isoform X3 [Ciconia boyciana]|uniref:tetratricopeptide repeat protein 16 isoform X3 n=1 Tax=Ciconia boyciana TaxID=52775 RepID=UPI003BA2FBD7